MAVDYCTEGAGKERVEALWRAEALAIEVSKWKPLELVWGVHFGISSSYTVVGSDFTVPEVKSQSPQAPGLGIRGWCVENFLPTMCRSFKSLAGRFTCRIPYRCSWPGAAAPATNNLRAMTYDTYGSLLGTPWEV
ncbi:unnamed protein product [Durusdinium trenchii]|uniref:Uncharacterized protein n=1 Tax=Durusdinium trenchii TaxID=1381693 RepID=A0ABP0RDT9_9DINO